jgi:hypothetical protein
MSKIELKKCTGFCGQELELTKENFEWRKDTNKWRGQCRKCQYKKIIDRIIEENGIKYQICTGECGLKLELNENNFSWKYKIFGYYEVKCKECCKKYSKIYAKENKEIISLKSKKYREEHKDEINEQKRKHYEENKDNINLIRKEEYKENREEILLQNKIRANKPENKEKKNKKNRERWENDAAFKLRGIISSTIRDFLKYNGFRKKSSILNYLPYTMDELKEHIEKQFLESGNEWMNWDNWGRYDPAIWNGSDKTTWVWHLDHIIPQADLIYDSMEHPNFLKCWALDNLRSYSGKDNIMDGVNRTRHKDNK